MSSASILGRERELAVLRAAVAAASGPGGALLVSGEPGIGKSALLAWVRATARAAGCTVLNAAGVESETHLPFGGIHQAITPLLHHLDGLPRRQREAVATALGLSEGARPDLFLIAEAAFALLVRERVRRPVVLLVDDLHWLDPQSHQILAFVARRGSGAGICVVGAIRPDRFGPFAGAGFPQLRVGGVDEVTAEALLRPNAGRLTTAELKRIRDEAQGNPLALLELPRSWVDGAPVDGYPIPVSAKLERAFAGRIADLPAGTRDALLVAAVGSSPDIEEILQAVAAFGTPDVTRDLFGPAVRAALITEKSSQVQFCHPLVRSGVVQRETMARRHAAHAALADVLAADRYRRCWHRAWSLVGPDDVVADELTWTVADSLRRGAVMSAVSSLERAAQLTSSGPRRGQRLMRAADHAFQAGRADVVRRLLREAARLDLTELDRARARWLTEALNDDVRADSAVIRQLCLSARRADALGDVGLALNLLLAAALRCWWAESGEDDSARVGQVLDGMAHARADPRHLAALSIADPVSRGSEVTRSLESAPLGDVRDGDSLRVYAMAAYGVGDLVLATDLLDLAEQAFRAEGRLGMLPVVLALQLHIRLDLGDWSGSVLAGQEVVTISRDTGQEVFAENNVMVQARGMALRGEWQAALDTMAVAEAEAERLGINDRICLGYQVRGAALLSADRPGEAFACLRRQYDPDDPGYHLRESFGGLALTIEAAVACGRIDEACAITRNLEAVTVVTPSPLLAVNLLYARAVLAPEDARDLRHGEALAHDLTRWPWLRARIQLSRGRWLADSGRPEQARRMVGAALEVFDRIGAVRWRDLARSVLEDLDGAHGGQR